MELWVALTQNIERLRKSNQWLVETSVVLRDAINNEAAEIDDLMQRVNSANINYQRARQDALQLLEQNYQELKIATDTRATELNGSQLLETLIILRRRCKKPTS